MKLSDVKQLIIIRKNRERNQLITYCDNLEEIAGDFDIIFMNDVIEHVRPNELDKLMSNLRNMLKSRGRLFIRTPNYDSLNRAIMGRNWYHFITVHCFIMTNCFLRIFAVRNGFYIDSVFRAQSKFKTIRELWKRCAYFSFLTEIEKKIFDDNFNVILKPIEQGFILPTQLDSRSS